MGVNFITGTGTDIGKTWLACALLRHWRAQGLSPAAFKPVLSGFDPACPEASDAGALLAALGREVSATELDAIAPWRFAAPLSPDMAAACEGRSIDFGELVAFTRRSASADYCAKSSSKASAASWCRSTTAIPCATGSPPAACPACW
jgi:dethiobiotin synthetase